MDDRTPVLIGGGQFTYRATRCRRPSPLGLLAPACGARGRGRGAVGREMATLDTVAVVAFTVDSPGNNMTIPRLRNPPASLARTLGATPRTAIYTETGGNSPQQLVNLLAERIARGEVEFALAAGAEFLGSLQKKLRAGVSIDDHADPEDDGADEPERVGDPRPGVTAYERAHGLQFPVNTYPLFENGLRARDGRSVEAHQRRMGELFAPYTKIAAANPHAWFPTERSAEELITVTERNRMVSWPYPKYLNSIIEVDQSAALILCSVAKARELGVPQDRWVFLHGCSDAYDLWGPLDRQNYHSSPAMRLTGKQALEMAGVGLERMSAFDLYSCFPVAVEIGAEEIGLSLDDPRGLTVTGGLPYFGGPGNNYVMHSIAEMTARLRRQPGTFGLVTGNGWYLTKQSVGVYGSTPTEGPWRREDPKVLQREIDALPHPEVVETPEGEATIETYTVVHDRGGYRMGIVVGRDSAGRRFVAVTPDDEATLRGLEAVESVGRPGRVERHPDGKRNLFTPAG
jgi:acetyl-CoA C-acetyltransferase